MLPNTRTRLVAPGRHASTSRNPLGTLIFEPWADLSGEMDRLVSSVLRLNTGTGTGLGADAGLPRTESAWVPAMDIEEREDAVRLAFEVPGVDPDALTVTVDDRVLTVSGERRFAREERADGEHADAGRAQAAYRLERRFGRFARSVTLPKTVDPDRIQARCEHGVLHLALPKRPEAQPRRIAIAAGTPGAGAPDPRRLDAGPGDPSAARA
jgi:HSP20 family protein